MRENLGGSLALQGLVGTVVIVVGEVGVELVVEVLSVGGVPLYFHTRERICSVA